MLFSVSGYLINYLNSFNKVAMNIHVLVYVDMFSFRLSKYLGTGCLYIAFPFVLLLTFKAKFSECLYHFVEVYEIFRYSITSLTLGIFNL